MLGWVTKEVIRQKKRIEACRSCSNTHTHSHTILQYWTLYSCPHRLQIHFALVSSGLALMAKQIMWEVLQLLLFLYVLVCVCVFYTQRQRHRCLPASLTSITTWTERRKRKKKADGGGGAGGAGESYAKCSIAVKKKKKKKATGNSQTSRTITPVAVRHGGGGVFIFCCSFLEVVRNKEFLWGIILRFLKIFWKSDSTFRSHFVSHW